MYFLTHKPKRHTPWSKGKLTGQKPPLKLKEIWAIRLRLQLNIHVRDLALFKSGGSIPNCALGLFSLSVGLSKCTLSGVSGT